MQLFYHPEITSNSKIIEFSKEESRHIIKVLRKKDGDLLNITDGKGNLYMAEIIQALDKKCVVAVRSREKKPKPWKYHLHIAIAPTKLNDRFEWFLEKATEIGVDEITPVFCDHSERKQVKMARLEKVILSAMKQSLKFELPKLNEPVNFKEFIRSKDWDLGLIGHCEDLEKDALKSCFPFQGKIMILIGPEGDFSVNEINQALSNDIKPVTFGHSRLRTETAGVVACCFVSLLNEIL